jgi:ribosomal protein S19
VKDLIIQKAEKKDDITLSKISVEAKKNWKYPEEWMKMWLKDLMITPDYIDQNFVYKLISRRNCGIYFN